MFNENFIELMSLLKGKRNKVLAYMLKEYDPTNDYFIATQEEIAEATKSSRTTINEMFKDLIEHGYIHMKIAGVYVFTEKLKQIAMTK